MDPKRTMTMNWDGLGAHNDDDFFDSNNRISAVVPIDLAGAESSDDDEFEDPRMSFASVISTSSSSSSDAAPLPSGAAGPPPSTAEYDIWMAAPLSIKERRHRLLQGMGLNSSKELLRIRTMATSKKVPSDSNKKPTATARGGDREHTPPSSEETKNADFGDHKEENPAASDSPDTPLVLVRSRSDGDIDQFSIETKKRKEQLIGSASKQRLTRTSSTLAQFTRLCKLNCDSTPLPATAAANNYHHHQNNENQNKRGSSKHLNSGTLSSCLSTQQLGAFFLIKNLDTGKEFIVKEFNEDGMWNRLSDLQTGRQLTMEEFEKSVGYSPVVKELMRRENVRRGLEIDGGAALERKTSVNAYLSKSFRYSKRRGVSLLKNINRVANSVTGLGSNAEKERENHAAPVIEPPPQKGCKGVSHGGGQNPEWVRVRSQGKNYKELTAMRFCQEIQAHQGSIWTIKFNPDGRYLASAGEDKVIHVWEAQECEIASLRPPEESANATPLHPLFCPSPDREKPPLPPDLSTLEKKKKGKLGSRKGNVMPDYVQLPETVFALSNEPVCSFEGHLDDVLDLSWSKSQLLLLSSSMDKTVRLWELETKSCLKLFAHNDYVTCIQFNPVNDDYFISGSLDAKVRIWNVPGRRVVDWIDLHEMVTAACYTPDGQGAAVGSHKGNCRMYSIADGKLNQTSHFDIQNKKKSAPKKITGFEFNPDNSNEVLVTSADSRVRIYDGSDVIQKFRGFRNTTSQIAASLSPDGKYVICASEDSNVYVWKREEPRNGKTKTIMNTRSHEYFQCKDVSVAAPWPGSIKFEPPTIHLHPKRNSKRVNALQLHPPTAASGLSPKKDDATNKTTTTNNKKHLPPWPNNKKSSNTVEKSDNNNNKNKNNDNNNDNNKDNDDNNEDNNGGRNEDGEKGPKSPEADPARITRSESGLGDSFSSASGGEGLIRYGDSPSMTSNHAPSPSWSPGWSWFDGGGSHGSDTMQATAWGLVIVTAGLGGEIRAYQNFGLPLRVGRQANLFRDLT